MRKDSPEQAAGRLEGLAMKSRLGRKIAVLLALSLLLAGCPGSRRGPAPPRDIERAWETLDAHCEAHSDDQVLCARAGFLEGRAAAVRTWGAAKKYKARLEATGKHRDIDGAVHAGELAELLQELDVERTWKWIMLGIGVAAGALAVGIPVGIAK